MTAKRKKQTKKPSKTELNRKKYLDKAKILKSEKILKSVPKRLTAKAKREITSLYNEYREVIEATEGEFKRIYVSEKQAKDFAAAGYATKGRYVWAPLEGAQNAKMQHGTLARYYRDKVEFELLHSEFKNIIGSEDGKTAIDKKLKEIQKQYKNLGLVGSIGAKFHGSGTWRRSFGSINELLNYVRDFKVRDKKGTSKRTQDKHKRELLSGLNILILEEMPNVTR